MAGMARLGRARRGRSWPGRAGQARLGRTGSVAARIVLAWQARPGTAGDVMPRQALAWTGRQGASRRGRARHVRAGMAWRNEIGPVTARRGPAGWTWIGVTSHVRVGLGQGMAGVARLGLA